MENSKLEKQVVEIYESKSKNIGLFLLSAFMTILGLIIVLISSKESKSILILIAGILALIFFGFASIYIFKQSFKKEAVLILNRDGFTNKKQTYSKDIPFISWSRVEDIYLKSMFTEDFVCIEIEDEEDYVESMSKSIKLGVKANMKMGFPAIAISANSLKDYDNEKLFDLFINYFNNYNNNVED